MKRIILVAVVMTTGTMCFMSFTKTKSEIIKSEIILESEFDKGFEDGYCEGWKDVKGEYAICPITPIPPMATISQSYDSYKDGYNTGFKAGMKAARND